ncbi:MAG TPA: hypothetical protein DIW43_09885 [Spongiibacteraceae bacterium]|nr:hypothetical protein [Spongiibacteraceae bacterium]MBN51819.1 hypothetical protein [Spongiibacteraceae bacterium]HCS27754.1 hypothetical protein [Spongiibacteraceae bacterium]|tara:strand:+ start:950 stop:1417 length:468 start_codon:yes stop_codon:yes gene_type:complete
MNWSLVSALADVLGATAVILSLIYLAFQIRDARRSFVAGAQQQLGGDFSAFMASIWSDREVFTLWNTAITDPEQLSEVESTRFGMIMFSMFAHFANVYELSRIDKGFLERYGTIMDRMLSASQVQGWWQRQSHTYDENSDFRRYINQRIAQLTSN